jgi:lipopolysaccharide/colanic/teichoic acid biosynthesis glycosyltransferase
MHQAGVNRAVHSNGASAPVPRPPVGRWRRILLAGDEDEPDALQRRLFDIGIATIGLVVFSPLLALIALLVKLESPGPVFFRQKRVGKDGKIFRVYKFRSMRVASPQEQTVPAVEDIESFKFRPVNFQRRVTDVGRVLRACSLDEMPQLLNVLKGDMHLVGPRPDEPEIVAAYRPEYHDRFTVKPGITGLAQVNGRSDLTYQEIMAYDLDYVGEHSFARDIRIMLRSLGVVLRREGAR